MKSEHWLWKQEITNEIEMHIMPWKEVCFKIL